MSNESEIIYRDFWDVPRIFLVQYHGRQYLFDCRFDESIEDYEEMYQVYVLPELKEDELNGSWKDIAKKAESYLGEVPVSEVKFDPTKRYRIDTSIINELEVTKTLYLKISSDL